MKAGSQSTTSNHMRTAIYSQPRRSAASGTSCDASVLISGYLAGKFDPI